MIRSLLDYLRDHQTAMQADLRALVELESPSDDAGALCRCATFLAARASELTRGRVTEIDSPEGPHLDVLVGDVAEPAVLVLGHYDTVWPVGTLVARPYRDDDGVARGPGVFDMKAGLVQGLWAANALLALGGSPPSIRFCFNSDEEVQSTRSRPVIEAAARRARVVLVLEPSLDGALKTARKGSGRFYVTIHGRAAHAGLDPGAGRSAISELAIVVPYLEGLADPTAGTTVNVGVVRGGTRANVIPAESFAEVDVRVAEPGEAQRIVRQIGALRPSRDGLSIDVSGGFGRPPMPRGQGTAALFSVACRIAREIGIDLSETSVGGGSDANFCAALGVPVLDGLGAVGGGAHAEDEHVLTDHMAPRSALTAALIYQFSEGLPPGVSALQWPLNV